MNLAILCNNYSTKGKVNLIIHNRINRAFSTSVLSSPDYFLYVLKQVSTIIYDFQEKSSLQLGF